MPVRAAQAFGSTLGSTALRITGRDVKKADASVALAFPEMSAAARRRLIREMYDHLGRSLGEILWMRSLSPDTLGALVDWRGLEHLEQAVAQDRGVVLFTGHCGNWELMAAAIALAGFDMNVIARSIDDPRVNEIIVESRGRFGVETIGRGGDSAARDILRTLRTGKILGVLIDQSIKAEVVECEFFGRPAPTPVGPARLAVRAGAQAIAGFIRRERNGRHTIEFREPIDARDADPAELTCRMNSEIEAHVRRHPEQWVWLHQRWRHRNGQRDYHA